MSFLDIIWFILITFLFVAYLMVLFAILSDLFRDSETNGWLKALWVIFLIFLPFLTALIYLIVRGRSMSERSLEAAKANQEAMDAYVRQVAGSGGGAEQISKAKALLDSGAITQEEFDTLKAKALS